MNGQEDSWIQIVETPKQKVGFYEMFHLQVKTQKIENPTGVVGTVSERLVFSIDLN